ncbi:MAG: hypothetical protein KDC26_12475 [Armatimonadetes bacterium]|nr:hypothetical protein [Armatimonadota bacterium]
MTEIVPERTFERFEGEDCLYRDHRGHRVIHDYDGSGTYHVLGEAKIVVDGSISAQTNGEFSHFVTVSASTPGLIEARITPNDPFPTDATIIEIDRFSIADLEARKARSFQVKNMSEVESLTSGGQTNPVAYHLNRATWRVQLPGDQIGVRLGKTYDQFHGRQRARVLNDGEMAGWWYLPHQNRDNRWAEAQFSLPNELIKGKTEMEITIDPPAGVPLWSVGEIYCLIATR